MTYLSEEYGLILAAPPDPGSYINDYWVKNYELYFTLNSDAFEKLALLELCTEALYDEEEEDDKVSL